jgi:hypothetical protein
MAKVSDDTYWITTALLTVAYAIAHQEGFQAMRVTEDGILKAWQGFDARLSHIREEAEQKQG